MNRSDNKRAKRLYSTIQEPMVYKSDQGMVCPYCKTKIMGTKRKRNFHNSSDANRNMSIAKDYFEELMPLKEMTVKYDITYQAIQQIASKRGQFIYDKEDKQQKISIDDLDLYKDYIFKTQLIDLTDREALIGLLYTKGMLDM